MTWQLMWRNVRAAGLNATLQLLVIYRWVEPHLGSQLICEVGLGFPTLVHSQKPSLIASPSKLFHSVCPTTTLT